MTHIKNSHPSKALANNINPYKTQFQKQLDPLYLQILRSTVYMLLHMEKRSVKSEKWASQALKETVVGFNGYTIYRVHIKDQNKVIQVKDLHIFEDYKIKKFRKLSDYFKSLSIFQDFLNIDEEERQELPKLQASQKVEHCKIKNTIIMLRISKKPKDYKKSVNIDNSMHK